MELTICADFEPQGGPPYSRFFFAPGKKPVEVDTRAGVVFTAPFKPRPVFAPQPVAPIGGRDHVAQEAQEAPDASQVGVVREVVAVRVDDGHDGEVEVVKQPTPAPTSRPRIYRLSHKYKKKKKRGLWQYIIPIHPCT